MSGSISLENPSTGRKERTKSNLDLPSMDYTMFLNQPSTQQQGTRGILKARSCEVLESVGLEDESNQEGGQETQFANPPPSQEGKRRIKFVYMSPTEKHSYRKRMRCNFVSYDGDADYDSSSLPNSHVRPISKSSVDISQSGSQSHSASNGFKPRSILRQSKSFTQIAQELNINIRDFNGFISANPKPKPLSVYKKVEVFLAQNGYPQHKLDLMQKKGGLQSISALHFFDVTTFLAGFFYFQSGEFDAAWDMEDHLARATVLRGIVFSLSRYLSISQMQLSHLKSPMVNKQIFVKFFAALLKRAEAALTEAIQRDEQVEP